VPFSGDLITLQAAFSETPCARLAAGRDRTYLNEVDFYQAGQLGSESPTGEQENLNSRLLVCLKFGAALVDLQIASKNGPLALTDSFKPVLVARAKRGVT
jgi:hypothetical protein